MAVRRSPADPSGPGGHRCRCGHYPTTHMRVVAATGSAIGSYRLDPTGPCAVCGEAACRQFSRSA